MTQSVRYHCVTVTEGGADFHDFQTPEEVAQRFSPTPDHRGKYEEILRTCREMELGDDKIIDGCTSVYCLKGM